MEKICEITTFLSGEDTLKLNALLHAWTGEKMVASTPKDNNDYPKYHNNRYQIKDNLLVNSDAVHPSVSVRVGVSVCVHLFFEFELDGRSSKALWSIY